MPKPEELNGTEILVVVDGDVIGSQRGATFNETNAAIDFSSKNARPMKQGYGRYSATVDLEMLYIPTASGHARLRTAARNAEHLAIIRREEGQNFESADAIVTAFNQNAPDQDAVVISVSFGINGEWTPIP